MRTATIALVLALAATLATVAVAAASRQQPDVVISGLDCSSDPEVVTLENQGDAGQELIGWRLVSDPPDAETFDLSVIGGLEAGVTVFVQSGPAASGVYTWGSDFVFRDDDPTDYARLVNAQGETVDEVSCPGPAATPTPTPAATATPEPAAAGADDIPNGGGPPPVPSGIAVPGFLPGFLMVVAGSATAAAGIATAVLSLVQRVSERRPSQQPLPVPATPERHRSARPHERGPSRLLFALDLLALTALFTLLLLRQR